MLNRPGPQYKIHMTAEGDNYNGHHHVARPVRPFTRRDRGSRDRGEAAMSRAGTAEIRDIAVDDGRGQSVRLVVDPYTIAPR